MVFLNQLSVRISRTFLVLLSCLALFACPPGALQKAAYANNFETYFDHQVTKAAWIETGVTYFKPLHVIELEVGNMVSWSTKEEVNNAYFVVQRSLDGINFKSVLQLKGAGNSQEEQEYQWLDTRTGDMRVFYRLQQIGLDGNFYFSETIISNRIKPNNILITAMSSPETDGLFSISLRSTIDASMYYALLDVTRQTKQEGKMSIVEGTNALTIDISDLKNGRYQLLLEANGEVEQVFILKVHPTEMPPLASILRE